MYICPTGGITMGFQCLRERRQVQGDKLMRLRHKEMVLRGWRVDSVVKGTHYSLRGPVFDFQHPHELSVTTIPRDPMPSSDLHRYQTCAWYTYTRVNVN